MRSLLENANLKVSSLDLSTTEKIPDNAKIIIIAGPKGTFQEKEISLIRDFVNLDQGRLLVALDPVEEISMIDKPAFGLRRIFKEWGIRCHDMLVYDSNTQNYDYFSGAYYISTYPTSRPHQIIKPLMEQEFRIFGSRCRPVESIQNKGSIFQSSELLYSSRDSWALSGWPNRKNPPQKNNLLDIDGPIPVIAISETKFKAKKVKSKWWDVQQFFQIKI